MSGAHDSPEEALEEDGTQRSIVLQLLRADHELRWTRFALEHELHDLEPAAIAVALNHLCAQGVVCAGEGRLWASPCARHLDALEFISI